MQSNEVNNYIFGTLRRQDTALRGIIRDLKVLKSNNKMNSMIVTVGAFSLLVLGTEVKYLKNKNDILTKEVDKIKCRLMMGDTGKREEVN